HRRYPSDFEPARFPRPDAACRGENSRPARVAPRHPRWSLTMSNLVKSFLGDRRGNVAVMGGLILPVAVAFAGMAMDYARGSTVRASLQAALDAAVLAGVIASDVASEQISAANKAFTSNVSKFS